MALPALTSPAPPDAGFDEDFSRALEGDKKQLHLRDTLRKLVEKEPEAFVRGIRSLMTE